MHADFTFYTKTCFALPISVRFSLIKGYFFAVTAIICNRKTEESRMPKTSSINISTDLIAKNIHCLNY